MTYTEWIDELKNNLLSAPDSECRRVLEYYAEAYADRREAGFSEARIIEEFGAPYDAARRILSELPPESESKPAPGVTHTGEEHTDDEHTGGRGDDTPRPKRLVEIVDSETGEPIELGEASDKKPDDGNAAPSGEADGKKRMSRGKKALMITAIVFGSLFAIAFIYFFIGVAVNDWKVVTDYSQSEYTCESDISALRVDGTVGKIEVEFYDGNSVCVKYPVSKRFFVTVTEKDGALTIKGPESSFPFWGVINIPDTVIMLPKDSAVDLELGVSAGKVKVGNGTFNKCRLNVSAGALELGNISCASAEFGISAGSVEVDSISCGSIKVHISAGDFKAESIVSDRIDIDISAGSAELGLTGEKEEYTVFVDKSAGSCNVAQQAGTTGKILNISVSAGSVEVDFKK